MDAQREFLPAPAPVPFPETDKGYEDEVKLDHTHLILRSIGGFSVYYRTLVPRAAASRRKRLRRCLRSFNYSNKRDLLLSFRHHRVLTKFLLHLLFIFQNKLWRSLRPLFDERPVAIHGIVLLLGLGLDLLHLGVLSDEIRIPLLRGVIIYLA